MPQSLVFSSISLFNCHTQRLTQRLPLTSLNLRCMSSNTSPAPSTHTHTHIHTLSLSHTHSDTLNFDAVGLGVFERVPSNEQFLFPSASQTSTYHEHMYPASK